MQERIVVFDVEMLNSDPSSMCSIGIVEYINKKIHSTYYSLIKPNNLSFDYHSFKVHGIRSRTLVKEKTFKEVWKDIHHYFDDSIVVSHDILSDSIHLRDTLNFYHIDYPRCLLSCTNIIAHMLYKEESKYNLEHLCSKYEYVFNAHNSLEDAKACGFLLFKMLEALSCDSLLDFHQHYDISFGKMKPHYYRNIISAENVDKIDSKDEKSYFTHKTISIIGNLKMSKEEFDAFIQKAHAFSNNRISTQTNYIILGSCRGSSSKKLLKAKALINEGQDIKILNEKEFLQYYTQPVESYK